MVKQATMLHRIQNKGERALKARSRTQTKRSLVPAARESGNLPLRVAEQVREMISRGALAPGLHLGQEALAARLAVSKVPVREALKLLAAEGVISHDHNRGFFVSSLSSDEAQQLFSIRVLLEDRLLETLEWPSIEQRRTLRALFVELQDLLSRGMRGEWNVRHNFFRRQIYELSPQKVLVREVTRNIEVTGRYRALLEVMVRRPVMPYDRQILRALELKDRVLLLRAFAAGRAEAEGRIMNHLQQLGL